jgi:2-keto-3-deoxy-L-rhamnonate aldolase RhmA
MVTTRTPRTTGRGLWLSATNPYALELLHPRRADWVGLDLQHGALDLAAAVGLIRVCERAGIPTLVRLAEVSTHSVSAAVDAGADTVVAPLIHTADQARELVHAARIPPHGARSRGISRRAKGPHEVEPTVLAMIESEQALAQAGAILEVAGLDGVFVGPHDLSLSLGVSTDDPRLLAALQHLAQLARERGRVFGMYAGGTDLARHAPHADLVALASDIDLLTAGADRLLRRRPRPDPDPDLDPDPDPTLTRTRGDE